MAGIVENGQKRLMSIVFPQLRNVNGSEFVNNKKTRNDLCGPTNILQTIVMVLNIIIRLVIIM